MDRESPGRHGHPHQAVAQSSYADCITDALTDVVQLLRDGNGRSRASLIEATLEFAERARVRLIAEGIETEAEHEQLRRLGIPFGQGYHYARPTTLAAAVAI